MDTRFVEVYDPQVRSHLCRHDIQMVFRRPLYARPGSFWSSPAFHQLSSLEERIEVRGWVFRLSTQGEGKNPPPVERS